MTNWKPSDAEVDAACAEFQRRYPLTGFGREWPDVMRKILIEAHDAAPEPDTTEFESALHHYRQLWLGHGKSTQEIDTYLGEVDAARQRLIAMYKERR